MKFPVLKDEIKNVTAEIHELESEKLFSVHSNSTINHLIIRFIINFPT